MNDPYKVLNIAPTASDDEVKHAYREMARKYHPDNYHDNPLADLAQEKMKEINEAYELIQKQRKNGYRPAQDEGYQSSAYSSDGPYGAGSDHSSGGGGIAAQVRMAINRGDISMAEQLLSRAAARDAEWNFLYGVVCSYRGRMDDAKHYIQAACRMAPDNAEYRQALSRFSNAGYRPAGYRSGGTMTYDTSCLQYCAALALCSMCFPNGFCCLPCYI